MFGFTVRYGFFYDDYHFIRPYPRAELVHAFVGPWDVQGIEVPFYRPLTVLFYAARFSVFGISESGLHVASLALFAAAAALYGLFILRLTGRALCACPCALLLVVHPSMPYSMVGWITNQMHAVEFLVVLLAFLWWTVCRDRDARWWIPLLVAEVVAFGVKEDGIVLLPAILAFHVVYKFAMRERHLLPPWPVMVATVLLGVALIGLRSWALGELGGYGGGARGERLENYLRGLRGVFVQGPARRPGQLAVQVWLMTTYAGAAVGAVFVRRARALALGGIAVALLFNAPFVFASKPEQYHLVALGAVLAVSAAIVALFEARLPRVLSLAGAGAIAVGLVAMSIASRSIVTDFAPCNRYVLVTDRYAAGWPGVPSEIKEWLLAKRKACRAGETPRVADLSIVAFGLSDWISDAESGSRFRRMVRSEATLFLRPRAGDIVIPVRFVPVHSGQRAGVDAKVNGRSVASLGAGDGQWHELRVPVPRPLVMGKARVVLETTPDAAAPSAAADRGIEIGEAGQLGNRR